MSAILALLLASATRAATPIEEAQQAEIDRVRAEVADQVQLAAYDLVDELVYGWVTEPVFENPTPVVLASVTVPVGLGTGLQALLENHVANVLAHNPTTNVRLVHCPACTAVVVHSGPEGTVLTRGIDNPDVLAEVGSAGQHALFVDVEAEGAWLVLRARLTRLTPELPIVWSHTLATSASTPALLRQPEALKSASEARQEYVDALRGRGPIAVPLRLAVRTYKGSIENNLGLAPPPFVWLESGVELAPTEARAWTSSILLGYSFIPQAYQGVMGQARISRLVTGRVRSHTRPDLYVFVGGAAMSVWGLATASFAKPVVTADDIVNLQLEGGEPRTSFGTFQAGLDLRLGNRIGVSTFLETIPDLANSRNLGSYVRIGSLGFQSMGTEVTFWF